MSQERTEAIVLRGVDFSESSQIVTLLTPDRGKVACMAKGARRPKSPLAGMMDTFNRLEIVYYWKESRSVQPLAEATLLDGFSGIKRDLEKATYAAFPLELTDRIAHENEPSEELFGELISGLEQLATWSGNVRAHCCWQVMQLLTAAGFAPSLDICCECGRDITESAGFAFSGGVVCNECPRDNALPLGSLKSLRALAGATEHCPKLAVGTEIMELLRQFSANQLEKDFRSIRVIEQLFGN